jgi:hypothetical protein
VVELTRSDTHAATDIVNIYHSRADNIGDKLCGPAQFFWPQQVARVNFLYQLTKPEHAILGGGQVFGQINTFSEKYQDDPAGCLVAWGVGVPQKGKNDAVVRDVASRFALFGTRNYEWRDELDFVPCASCMSSALDNAPAPTQEVVVYAHRKKTPSLASDDAFPLKTNKTQDAEAAIHFIAQGETVVTSSYHGVYWAQLLGRKVICIPYNDKFSTLQYPPVTATETSWKSKLGRAKQTHPLLDEYREINRQFAAKVEELLQING